MIFYTKVLGISMGLVGTLFLTARCIDAFTDVTMGRIVDRMNPKKDGRFRPWLRRMCAPVAISMFSDVPVLVSRCVDDGQSDLYVCNVYIVGKYFLYLH